MRLSEVNVKNLEERHLQEEKQFYQIDKIILSDIKDH